MQMLAMCESGPGTVANERAHRLFYRRLRQSLIDSKRRDALVVNNTRLADAFRSAPGILDTQNQRCLSPLASRRTNNQRFFAFAQNDKDGISTTLNRCCLGQQVPTAN